MAWVKTHDLAVKVGTYTQNGQEKGRWENVGQVMSGENGDVFLLKRTFNPAGVPVAEGKDSIIISKFPVRDRERDAITRSESGVPPRQAAPASSTDDLNDEIPF